MIQVSSVRVYNTWHVCCVVCGHNPAKPPSVTIRLTPTPTPTPTPGHHWPVVQVQEVLSVLFMFCFRVYIPHVSDFTCSQLFLGPRGKRDLLRPPRSGSLRPTALHGAPSSLGSTSSLISADAAFLSHGRVRSAGCRFQALGDFPVIFCY